jgi:Zn-dependent M28 family amino/carboxypeptidase
VTLALLPAGGALAAPASPPSPPSPKVCETRNNTTYQKLLECMTVDGVLEHEQAFQAIAAANGGSRAAGQSGYEASVAYVVSTLAAAGWDVSVEEFPYTYVGPSTLRRISPAPATFATGPFTGSGSGSVTGAIRPVDLQLGLGNASTSGCEASDFAGFPAGNVALVQRGTCSFAIKALNAQAAGASAVVIFNQGNTLDRQDLIIGTLAPSTASIPVVGASYADGVNLADVPAATVQVVVPAPESRPQKNVIAELHGENEDNVVMAGAHLDSVQAGPGINDNGSGSSVLLEVAQQIKKLEPVNTVRLAWWGAEESGLVGSTAYVQSLSQAEKDRIALYLNFDMVASPNYIFMTYDGDQSGWPAPVAVPEGSVQIEDLFESLYTRAAVPYDDAEFSGRSDYQEFIKDGIPSGGLFTGAEVPKTAAQAAIWGGTAGVPYDPCYHKACDTIANLSRDALDVNADVIAAAILTYAYSTQSVNGVPGEPVPGGVVLPAPAGPRKTVNPAASGGLAPDQGTGHGIAE